MDKLLTVDELENYKKRCVEISEEISVLSKKKDCNKIACLMREYANITKTLKRHLKLVKKMEQKK